MVEASDIFVAVCFVRCNSNTLHASSHDSLQLHCWGHYVPKPGEEEPKDGTVVEPAVPRIHEMQFCARNRYRRQHALFHIQARQLPRVVSTPSWPDEPRNEAWELVAEDFIPAEKDQKPGKCTGPRFTFTGSMYFKLIDKCPKLTTLVLEYCNINCRTIQLSHLPATLKTLSLKGAKCFNLLMDRSFLFKIQDALPDLETLDFSECDWLDPSSFLPLSKLRALTRLRLRDCPRLSEFVAYSSLASRYGFRVLQSQILVSPNQELDLRGCPVGDSEVSSLSWLPELRVLQLASHRPASAPGHRHHRLAKAPSVVSLQQWEIEEPDFFKKHIVERDTDLERKDCNDPYTL
ncbi:hypothetical protein RR46_00153 [Papilio xuthus]|uniref:Uncharacterized protein n=1 Tax=Papilio xuthus TaxID=66420 RepID=A0A0N1PKG8_PAPXU|nr:hypothetical protein RR46_00153 [Papilio xuthus]